MVCRTLLIAAVTALAPGLALAQQSLTVTSQYGEGRPQTVFWEDFSAIVEEKLPGAYDIEIVIGGALGGEKEDAQAIRLGALTASLSTVANMTTWVPEGAVLDLPFVLDDAAHIDRVLDGPLGEDLIALYREEGFHVPAFIVFGNRHLMSDRPLPTPDDLAGLSIRSLQSDVHLAYWRALGAQPAALPITEAYNALSTGVVAAMDLTKSGYDALKIYEVAPVLTETGHMTAVGVVYFNADFWDSLSEAHRTVFQEASERAAEAFNRNAAAEQAKALERAVADGARVVSVDRAPWREAAAAFSDDFVARRGGPTADGLAAIRAAREE